MPAHVCDAVSYTARCGHDTAVPWCGGQKDHTLTHFLAAVTLHTFYLGHSVIGGVTVMGVMDIQGLFFKLAVFFTSVRVESKFRRAL